MVYGSVFPTLMSYHYVHLFGAVTNDGPTAGEKWSSQLPQQDPTTALIGTVCWMNVYYIYIYILWFVSFI